MMSLTTSSQHHVMNDDGLCWTMCQFPPFYTMQPVPATLQRQLSLWANVLVHHAIFSYETERTSTSGTTPIPIRLFTSSDTVFVHEALQRTLPRDAAELVLAYMADHMPQRCMWVDGVADSRMLMVVCCEGGWASVENAFFDFILEDSSSATTAADLQKNGVVVTFDELVDEAACFSRLSSLPPSPLMNKYGSIIAASPLAAKPCGRCTLEQAIRATAAVLSDRMHQRSSQPPRFAVQCFNMDGSTTGPYEGVKIGG